MAERLLSDLPEGTALFNKPVRTIQWQGSFREEGDDARVFPVRVECEDGDAFLADHVIITVPLGEDTDTSPCPARPLPPAGTAGDGLNPFPASPLPLGRGWKGVWGGRSISDTV